MGKFKYISYFSNDRAFFEGEDGVRGLIDKQGNIVFSNKYINWIGSFEDGRAIAIFNIKGEHVKAIIDQDGNVIFKSNSDITITGTRFKHRRVSFIDGNGLCGFLDNNGKIVIPAQYDEVLSFNSGVCPVMQSKKEKVPNKDLKRGWGLKTYKKWGIIDIDGIMVMAPKFDNIRGFDDNGISVAKLNGNWFHINKRGENIYEEARL